MCRAHEYRGCMNAHDSREGEGRVMPGAITEERPSYLLFEKKALAVQSDKSSGLKICTTACRRMRGTGMYRVKPTLN